MQFERCSAFYLLERSVARSFYICRHVEAREFNDPEHTEKHKRSVPHYDDRHRMIASGQTTIGRDGGSKIEVERR